MIETDLKEWTKELCHELGISVQDTVVHINIDGRICRQGQDGCVATYEVGNPSRFVISINKNLLSNREKVCEALRGQIECYKWHLGIEREERNR